MPHGRPLYNLEPGDDLSRRWEGGCMPALIPENFNPDPPLKERMPSFHSFQREMIQNYYRYIASDHYRKKNYKNAYLTFYKNARRYGDVRSLTCIGYMLFMGKGVSKKRMLAVDCFKRASQKGDPHADRMLVVYYEYLERDSGRTAWYSSRSKNMAPIDINKEWGFDFY